MDKKIDRILRSKYMSLFCALINAYFAMNSLMNGATFWFFLCGIFSAICFKNYINATN